MKEQNIANWEKRLINLFIDAIIIMFIYLIFIMIVGVIIVKQNADLNQGGVVEFNSPYIILAIYVLYYILLEGLFGVTIGKLLTKTKVVTNDGEKVPIGNIIVRSLSRLLFFEVFFFFKPKPVGLHDSLARTIVVNKK